MQGIIVGIDRDNNKNRHFRVVAFEHKGSDWKFSKQRVEEKQLLVAIQKGMVIVNAEVKDGKLKGRTGDFSRFENKVNKPLVIISEMVSKEGTILGFKIANGDGVVKNITNKELVAYCDRISKKGGIPVQNGMYVPEKDGQKAHIRCYPNGEYIKEEIVRKKSANAKPAQVNEEKNSKSISKLEEIFNSEQIKEIKLGKKNGVNIRIYGNAKLSAEQMKVIREGLEDGINAQLYADPEFSVDAMRILRADMKYGVDVSYYLNPQYNAEQLSELANGFISGVDVSAYADPKNDAQEMAEIRMRLEAKLWAEQNVKEDSSWK